MSKKIMTMKERPASERPYEKCLNYGPEHLSDGELLAVVIRSGTKDASAVEIGCRLLDHHPVYKGLGGLYHLDRKDLKEIEGIGDVKATELLCVLELSRRLSRACLEPRQDFSSPEYIAQSYMEEMRHLDCEIVKVLFLDTKHRLLRDMTLSQGTTNGAAVPVKNLFTEALRISASFMILLHNHPSGSPEPSAEDLLITEKIREMGKLLEIPLSDHIIIGDQCYLSFCQEGIL